jgi:hypothetical protein
MVGAPSLLGPFGETDRRQPHMYARDIRSDAGACVCKADPWDGVHSAIAPGLGASELAAAIRKSIAGEPREFADDLRRGVVRQLVPVAKSAEKQFLLGLAYVAGRDPRIRKGMDGGRDFLDPEDLERACWSFLPGGGQVGIGHIDGTLGHLTVTENYIYRGPDWEQPSGLILKSGMAWLIGGLCDDHAWRMAKAGHVNGFSPQGGGRRLRVPAMAGGLS